MYATNEDEFNSSDGDWVYLHQTPPINTSIHDIISLVDRERSNSSSSSSISSISSKSERSDSISSLSSIEAQPLQNFAHIEEIENHLIIEEPILNNSNSNDVDTNNDLLVTGDLQEEVLSSETTTKQGTESETTPIVNEYDLFNGECDLSDEAISSPNDLRQRTGTHVQHLVEHHSLTGEHEMVPVMIRYGTRRRNNALIICGFLFLIFITQLILVRAILSQRLAVNKVMEELDKTNQRLDEVQTVSIEEIEERLTKQFDEKLHNLIHQKTMEYEIEKNLFIEQLYELHQMVDNTKGNLTNIYQHLSDENEQLQKQISELEYRLQVGDKSNSQKDESCPEGVDCSQLPKSSLEILLATLIKQTTSIAENTSINLSGIFENLKTTVNDMVDNRHEYVEQSLQKLADISNSQTAEQVHTTLRRGVEHISSTFRKAQSTYITWLRARAEQREQARMNNVEKERNQKTERHPWRWTFQRGHDREQLRHQTPITKKHSTSKDYVCHAPFTFKPDPLSSMKSWVVKFFRG